MTTTLEYARFYVNKCGFSVIPLKEHEKIPAVKWKEYQSRKPTGKELNQWFGNGSKFNIGIVTGKISNLTVVDVDNDAGMEFAKNNCPVTPAVKTGSGKYHFYYNYEEGSRNYQKRTDLDGIDLRSEGGQVAAPPSIHPSTLKQYEWSAKEMVGKIPTVELPSVFLNRNGKIFKKTEDGKILQGQRDEFLTSQAGAMRARGMSEEAIISALMIENYQKCEPPLAERQVKKIAKSVGKYKPKAEPKKDTIDSKGYIVSGTGKIKVGASNTLNILNSNQDTWKIQYNEMDEETYINGNMINDAVVVDIVSWIEKTTNTSPWPKQTVKDCLFNISKNNKVNPLLSYLKSLTWDNVPRISYLPQDIFGLSNTTYLQDVFKVLFVQAVARAFNPGCKADQTVLLIGGQGCGKSMFVESICPDSIWHLDYMHGVLHDKDSVMSLKGKWIVEMSELSAISKSSIESTKAFLTRCTDEYRKPYEAYMTKSPRKCVFIGTTNDETPLKDLTGNRRFLIVRCADSIDWSLIKKIRDQLWAEAIYLYESGYKPYIDSEESAYLQKEALEPESFEEYLRDELMLRDEITLIEIADILGLQPKDMTKSVQIRIGFAMRNLSWKKVNKMIRVNGKVKKQSKWVKHT